MTLLIKIIEIFITALIGFLFTNINKKLDKADKAREEQKAKQEATRETIAQMQSEIKGLQQAIDEWQMRTARYRIIRFDDEEQEGRSHSSDHWEQIAEDIDMYQAYVKAHPEFQNHKGTAAMERISKIEMERRHQNA